MKKTVSLCAPVNGNRPFLVNIFLRYGNKEYLNEYRYMDLRLAGDFVKRRFAEDPCFCAEIWQVPGDIRQVVRAKDKKLLFRSCKEV